VTLSLSEEHQKILFHWAIIGTIIWLGHFLLASEFGLYEDDYIYALPWFGAHLHDLRAYCWEALIHPIQGRPLYFPLQAILTFAAFRVGGLQLCHLLSFFILWAACVLFYELMRRQVSSIGALSGTLMFALFPLDTSRQIIMHQGCLLVPLVVLVGSFLLFSHGHRVLAHLLAATLLLTYESSYLPFIIAPFFVEGRFWPVIRRFLLHATVCGFIAGAVFLMRSLLGEARASDAASSVGDILPKILWACIAGPWYGLVAIATRPVDAWWHSQPVGYLVAIIVCFLFFLSGRYWLASPEDAVRFSSKSAISLGLGGLIAWVVSYLLDFRPDYYPPVVSIGRLSAEHNLAALGAAILSAVLVHLFTSGRQSWRNRFVMVALSLFFGGLAAFAFHVQDSEYVASWQQQKDFWIRLVPKIQDVKPGDVIVLEIDSTRNGAIPITQGFTQHEIPVYNTFAFPRFLKFGYEKNLPTFHGYAGYVHIVSTGSGALVESPSMFPTLYGRIDHDNLIFIRTDGGELKRVAGPTILQGVSVFARPQPPATSEKVKLSPLFWRLFGHQSSDRWLTLRGARSYPR
jgi:hypothetical protein